MRLFLFISFLLVASQAFSQTERYLRTQYAGEYQRVLIVGTDTVPVMDIDSIPFAVKRNFVSRDEQRRYSQLKNYAIMIYPYAAEAIRMYRLVKRETANMSKSEAKAYLKAEEKRLTGQYESKLRSLTKVQGYILLKMVERELKVPFFDVLSELRGGWQAFKWQQVARWWGFNLKDGYSSEKDPLLESILQDLNISYK